MSKTFLFQAIQFSQTVQFSVSMPLVLFNPQIGHFSGATTPGQSGPWRNGNNVVFRIPQSPSINGTSVSDCLVSYPGHSLGGGLIPLCILQPQPIWQIFDSVLLVMVWRLKYTKTEYNVEEIFTMFWKA